MSGSSDREPVLTENIVIIIACVCGVIIVTLLVTLFCFICRRRRNAAKYNQGTNQGDPPPYNVVASNKKPQTYDNQDNNHIDSYPNRDVQAGVVPRSPIKDRYMDLTERGGGGCDGGVDPMLNESGYNTGGGLSDPNAGGPFGGGKPKKVIYEVVV